MVRSDRRKGEILVGAARAIRRLGLRRAGMREIAHAAGLSTGNLYYYFRNKEELIYFCQDRTLDGLLAVAREARTRYGTAAQLRWLIRGHLRLLLGGEDSVGALHLELEDLPPPLYRKLVRKRDRYERAVRAIFVDGQRSGVVRAGDPKLAAFALLGALNWTARWYRPGGVHSVDRVAEAFSQQLLEGLVQKPVGSAT